MLGQLRALGTKQHLKSKFGSGYELTIKYHTSKLHKGPSTNDGVPFVAPSEVITQFVSSLFPTSHFLSDNGGLMTFTIPSTDMQIGVAFSEIEAHKTELFIEDYSISQSTLEQVFIRTVQKHTPIQEQSRTLLLSSTSRQRQDDILGNSPDNDLNEADEVIGIYREALNTCGCTVKFTKISSGVCCFLFLLFFILSLALQVSVLIFFAIICLIVFCGCCMLCTCPCCKPPKDDDE